MKKALKFSVFSKLRDRIFPDLPESDEHQLSSLHFPLPDF